MKRIVSQARVGEHQIRHRTRIEDLPTPEGSEEARVRQFHFVQELAQNWSLLACGMQMFQRLSIYHSGSAWVAEAEAVVEEVQVYD